MHFASFIINLLAWTFAGIALGFFLHKGVRTKQNGSVLIGALASLSGGIFSSMVHGMFPDIGIDFFNLGIAFATSLVFLYAFAPNTRESIVAVGSESIDRTKSFVQSLEPQDKIKSPYFTIHFWKNITSTFNP